MQEEKDDKPFKCMVCDKGFKTNSHLKGHVRTHTGEKCYTCDECGKKLATNYSLKIHKRSHMEKSDVCNICDQRFIDQATLKRHILSRHENKKNHLNENLHVCSICDKSFPFKSKLRKHMNVHIRYKPFTCTICEKKFAEKYLLEIHQGSHLEFKKVNDDGKLDNEDEKSFVCALCSKTFCKNWNLKRHIMRTHSKGRPISDSDNRIFEENHIYIEENIDLSNVENELLTVKREVKFDSLKEENAIVKEEMDWDAEIPQEIMSLDMNTVQEIKKECSLGNESFIKTMVVSKMFSKDCINNVQENACDDQVNINVDEDDIDPLA